LLAESLCQSAIGVNPANKRQKVKSTYKEEPLEELLNRHVAIAVFAGEAEK
jgi:hypothetical protein